MRTDVIRRQSLWGLGIFFACLAKGFLAYGQDTTRVATDTLFAEPSERSTRPVFRPRDRYGDPFSDPFQNSPLLLKDPPSLANDLQLDTGRNLILQEKIGDVNYRPPISLSFDEFSRYQDRIMAKDYWKNRSKALDGESAVTSKSLLPKIYLSPTLDRIFGGDHIEFQIRGYANLDFGGAWQKVENPNVPIRQQRNGGFEFNQQMNMSVTGKIGEKMQVTANFDNNNSFSFQNRFKVEYQGLKEDILKTLEFGNVGLPLNNSLIRGSQNLFGVKAKMQFGKMFVTAIASTQRGKQSTIKVSSSNGGASQGRPFEIQASNYDENRHFFLGHFFRDNYETWLSTLPQVASGINITRVEVYVINRQNNTQTQRNVIGFMDLAESQKTYRKDLLNPVPGNVPSDNSNNTLYQQLLQTSQQTDNINDGELENNGLNLSAGLDYELITSARKLEPSEFTIHPSLGYISIQRKLQNDESLAVSYQYTYNGRVYNVGELSENYAVKDDNQVAILKLLRPRKVNIKDGKDIIPTWDLMMKNAYNLNVSQLKPEGFELRVIYRDDRTGVDNPQLQEGTEARTQQLIHIMGLDRLNPYNDPVPDGNFDFVEGFTVNPQTGLIIFPYLEPFNTPLRNIFNGDVNEDALIEKYIFDTLYHTTRAEAELVTTKNKFYLTGSFSSGSGSEVVIQGFNISPGSVKVYSGGVPLVEGQDYSVDYTLGKVNFMNPSILNSGKDIDITYEQQDPFAFQTRSLLGTRFDYQLNKDINLGATLLYYNERPIVTRQAIGEEPPRNFQYGFDLNLNRKSRLLTKLVDALPILQTKEESDITLNAEFAQLLPGTSNKINKEGTSFIDDFENAAKPYMLMTPEDWKLSSVPLTPDGLLDPSGGETNNVDAGSLRARLAWYKIDPLFYRDGGNFKPGNLSKGDMQNHYIRRVIEQEIFPNKERTQLLANEQIFDIAFYPEERGPYNYSLQQNADGTLHNPDKNWGGITTAIRSEVDFDKANIEYIEFWMLDPFLQSEAGKVLDGRRNTNNKTGGKLVFHLGSISEDIIRDGKFGFENGLPADGNPNSSFVASNSWGRVTTQQYVNNAFDNDANARANQDVGFDGLDDIGERMKFEGFLNNLLPEARRLAAQDPAADNFLYPLAGEYDERDAKLLERYKNFNGTERNSPVATGNQPFSFSGSNLPDSEDLNQDNTLTKLEEYYSYSVDLSPGALDVGTKYIVDKIVTDNNETGETVSWYLFRVPIRQFDRKVGEINDFKSIKYLRMYLTGFSEPVVLRLAKFGAIGNQWRRYEGNLGREDLNPKVEPGTDFSVSTVSVEENGSANDLRPAYIAPLARDFDNASTVRRRLNEKAIQVCVDGLEDGEARAIYKNTSVDLFNYNTIKMFMSAHPNTANSLKVKDYELTGFIRLGTDFDQNYFEIEVPLKITPNGSISFSEIWPEENQIALSLDELYALKIARDRAGFSLDTPYPQEGPKQVGHHFLRLLGRPDLSDVKTIMIGVRNIKSADAISHDVCLWANELRVTDFDRTAGWATNINASAKLADLGTISGSYRHVGFGYGDVHSKISERSRGVQNSYGVTTMLNIDKLLPKKAGLVIPMYFSYNKAIVDPRYDPANPDIRIDAALRSFATDEERDSYQKLIRDETTQRSINFTNVRKIKTNPEAKSHIWDVENFGFTYAYSESKQTNFNIKENTTRNIRGGVSWGYNFSFQGFEPFKNAKWLDGKYLKLIKDFNFNPLPASISAQGDVNRSFSKLVYRNSAQEASIPNFKKFMVFNRAYNMQWNLTQSISLNYAATANAIVDEPEGDIDTKEKRDSIIANLKKLGRMKNFTQNITANYSLPLNKFPLTDWINADYQYAASYRWQAGPLEKVDSLKLGNNISNTRNQTLSSRLNIVALYNKIGFLKKINQGQGSSREKPPAEELDSLKRPPDFRLLKGVFRLIMSVRDITISYGVTEGTTLPGFSETPGYFGLDKQWASPGLGFVFGKQDANYAATAAEKGWIVSNHRLSVPFKQNRTRDLSITSRIEPIDKLNIQISLKKNASSSFQQIFRYDNLTGTYMGISPSRNGAYKISFISIKTAFENNGSLNSTVFETFKENINTLQTRFSATTGNSYEEKSQDLLIPAFIAAYTGRSAETASLVSFPRIPLPNWRIDYTGLGQIPSLKKIFRNISINHAYTSSYSAANIISSLEYQDPNYVNLSQDIEDYNKYGFAEMRNGKLTPIYIVNGDVMISETFGPLVGINIVTAGNMNIRFEYKRKRDVSLRVANAQVTELISKDWTVEIGVTKTNWRLPFKSQGRIITLKNDISFRLSMSYSNSRTIQRKIDEPHVITLGNINFQLRPNITYKVNKGINLQAYFERNVNEPLISSSYRRSTTRGGIKITLSLSQ